jgi:hypothetical protein
MKWIVLVLIVLNPFLAFWQIEAEMAKPQQKSFYFGIKAGLNFTNITNASSINARSQTGYHAGILVNCTRHYVICYVKGLAEL